MICTKRRASELYDEPFEQENETYRKRRLTDPLQASHEDEINNNSVPSTLFDDDLLMEDTPSSDTYQSEQFPPSQPFSTDSTSLIDDLFNTLTTQQPNDQTMTLLQTLQSILPDLRSTLHATSSPLSTAQTLLSSLTTQLSDLQVLAFQQLQLRTDAIRRGMEEDLSTTMSADELKGLDERIVGLSALVAGLEAEVHALMMGERLSKYDGRLNQEWMSGSQGIGIAAL